MFPCSKCHNETEDHAAAPFDTCICRGCRSLQPLSHQCKDCKLAFGLYFCKICVLWYANLPSNETGLTKFQLSTATAAACVGSA